MKTTIELPDSLFRQIKATALKRGVSLKELFTHALKREVGADAVTKHMDFEVNDIGLPILTRKKKAVTSDMVRRLQEDE